MNKRREIGNIGEKIFRNKLSEKGFKIIDKNVVLRSQILREIDIIAKKGDKIFFFEVRCRNIYSYKKFAERDDYLFSMFTLYKRYKFFSSIQLWFLINNINLGKFGGAYLVLIFTDNIFANYSIFIKKML